MNEVLSLVLASMHADLARLDHAAMNLANAQTVGYKREIGVRLPFAARVDLGAQHRLQGETGEAQAVHLAVHVDARGGTLKSTGQPLDLALAGPGWFEVQTAGGTAYTRQGNFRLDARGRLVTPEGDAVMGVGGEIVLVHGNPSIDASGRVFEGGAGAGASPVAQLRIVQFDPAARIERLGDGLVLVHGEAIAAPEGSARVEQGFLENSNVSPAQEMVQLLQSVRHLETMQKVATGYDEMLATSIRRLGEPS